MMRKPLRLLRWRLLEGAKAIKYFLRRYLPPYAKSIRRFFYFHLIFIDIFAAVGPRGEPFYPHIARSIVAYANTNGNCALVVSATCPNELELVREFASNMPILISGIAALRADAAKVVSAGKDSRGKGMITNSSRDIIFASSGEDFAEAALFLSAVMY